MVFLMIASKLAKHSVMVAIDYWLAAWTSSANATNYTSKNETMTNTEVNNATVLGTWVAFRDLHGWIAICCVVCSLMVHFISWCIKRASRDKRD